MSADCKELIYDMMLFAFNTTTQSQAAADGNYCSWMYIGKLMRIAYTFSLKGAKA